MPVSLRVLIVEDNPDDAELLALHLVKEDFQPDWRRVETESDYLTALETPLDLILSDWSLPRFSGLRALQLLRERQLDIPFIIISGSIGEEAAIDALRQGADDYVLKDRPARLGSAIRRALEDRRLRQERKQAEAALRESEARFRRLAENAQDLIYRYEFVPRRGFTYVSPAATLITGYTPEEHYADPDLGRKLVYPEDRPLLEQYFQGGGVFREPLVLRWLRKDGRIIWTEQRNVPIYDAAGNLIAIEGVARDITERKQQEVELQRLLAEAEQSRRILLSVVEDQRRTEEALAAERTLLRTLVDHLPDAVYVKDVATRKLLANPADVRNIGVASEAEVLGKTDFDLFPHELAEAYYADDRYVLQAGQPILNREERIMRPDRVLGWQLTSKVPLRDGAGNIVGLIGIGHDITARKQAEEALRTLNEELEARIAQRTAELARASERLELATRAAGIGIWDWDIREDRLVWDETTLHLLGVSAGALTGNYATFLGRLHPDDVDRVNRAIQNALRGATGYSDELRMLKADGTSSYLQTVASITYEQGQAVRMIGVVWDITARKQAELELRMFNELMVGREARIIELKEEVNRLSIELGRPAPYPPVWETSDVTLEDLTAAAK